MDQVHLPKRKFLGFDEVCCRFVYPGQQRGRKSRQPEQQAISAALFPAGICRAGSVPAQPSSFSFIQAGMIFERLPKFFLHRASSERSHHLNSDRCFKGPYGYANKAENLYIVQVQTVRENNRYSLEGMHTPIRAIPGISPV